MTTASRLTWLVCIGILIGASGQDPFTAARLRLLDEIRRDAAATADATGRPAFSRRLMMAMELVPRHRFVPPSQIAQAYQNRPLPIGHGQTISQPYIVALMTELLDTEAGDVVLEVGTGSGYQAAVLAKLVRQVYTMEIIAPLATGAATRLATLGYTNVEVRTADGYYGWPEHGPYDGILVTAAANSIPPPLIAQLKPGGRMLIPVGAPFHTQDLILLEKDTRGSIRSRSILPVAFVPLTGAH
ncbi:MAG: protein-L-isoaspartate(D-aspartate) O-methyltransferase [Sphingomonadaceae bacterium]